VACGREQGKRKRKTDESGSMRRSEERGSFRICRIRRRLGTEFRAKAANTRPEKASLETQNWPTRGPNSNSKKSVLTLEMFSPFSAFRKPIQRPGYRRGREIATADFKRRVRRVQGAERGEGGGAGRRGGSVARAPTIRGTINHINCARPGPAAVHSAGPRDVKLLNYKL